MAEEAVGSAVYLLLIENHASTLLPPSRRTRQRNMKHYISEVPSGKFGGLSG